jgi:hypothetical protein
MEQMVRARVDTVGAPRTTLRPLPCARVVLDQDAGLSASDVAEITGVGLAVLTCERARSDVSVTQRVFWAAKRAITRLEEEAYSLLDIFGVNMPTVYSDG